jgi:hypothetical protein
LDRNGKPSGAGTYYDDFLLFSHANVSDFDEFSSNEIFLERGLHPACPSDAPALQCLKEHEHAATR